MIKAATQNATRFHQTATLASAAVMIADPPARARVRDALQHEGLTSRVVTMGDFTIRGIEGAPVAALVWDGAPAPTALTFLRRTRAPASQLVDLPLLLYVPPRADVAQLLIAAGAFPLIRGEVQSGTVADAGRLRAAIRALLESAPADAVYRRLMLALPDLTQDVQHICRFACGKLAARKGDTLTVARVAKELGMARRTLERRFQSLGLPKPKEFLDWIVVVFGVYVAGSQGTQLYALGPRMGFSEARMRRTRLRLRTLRSATSGVARVLQQLSDRITRFRLRLGLALDAAVATPGSSPRRVRRPPRPPHAYARARAARA